MHLQRLHLFGNPDLKGTLPTQLGRMSSLTEMYLNGTHVSGTIPTEFGRLGALEELSVQDTLLTGTMPRQVCRLPHLNMLSATCHGEHASVQCDCCTNQDCAPRG